MKLNNKIYIEISLVGVMVDNEPKFLSYEYLETEGTTLDELLDNATIFTADQDGGEGPFYTIDELPTDLYHMAVRQITKEFNLALKNQ